MKNANEHLKAWEEFVDSSPTVAGDFERIRFTAGNSSCKIQKISFGGEGRVSFSDITSEYIDRTDYSMPFGGIALSRAFKYGGSPPDHRSYEQLEMVAVADESENFQRSLAEDNILPLEFNTMYNLLLNLAWTEMYKFRI